jgi:hypothetical protein
MLSIEELRRLGDGTGSSLAFDLSIVHGKFYEPLFRTLQKIGPETFTALTFSCDRLAEESSSQISNIVMSSIAKNRSKYLRNLTELLAYLVQKSTILHSLTLSNLPFHLDQLDRIGLAIGQSKSLDRLNLDYIHVGDPGLLKLLDALAPSQVRLISLTHCRLTHASIDPILAFIESRPALARVSQFDVSPEEFSRDDISSISRAIHGSPRASGKRRTLIQLQKENQELKRELAQLKQAASPVQYSENVFVIGKGADQFVAFLREIDARLTDLEQQKASLAAFQ